MKKDDGVKKWGDAGPELEWRLIGHLQKNKARRAVELFDSVDSLDSLPLAATLDRLALEQDRFLPVLIEVNTAGEASKTGIEPGEFPKLLDHVLNSPRLNLQGLMTIGPLTDDEAQVRRAFASLRELSDRARSSSGRELPVLSMHPGLHRGGDGRNRHSQIQGALAGPQTHSLALGHTKIR